MPVLWRILSEVRDEYGGYIYWKEIKNYDTVFVTEGCKEFKEMDFIEVDMLRN